MILAKKAGIDMATVAESLFGVSPESLMATREQRLQEQAMQYGRMSPIEAARAGFYEAGSRLGGAVGGLLGAEDPELMRVRQRQQLLQGINPADPASLRAAAQKAMEANDFVAAQELASRALAAEAKMASTAKDIAAATRERQQAIPADIQKAQRIAQLQAAIPQFESAGDTERANMAKNELAVLQKEKAGAPSELGKLLAERAALDPAKDKEQYDAYTAKIKKLTTGGGIGSEIAAGLSPLVGAMVSGQAKKAGETIGSEFGKNVVSIEGKYTAKNAVDDALDVLKKGIYAGGYGPLQEATAKYTKGVIGSPERLANTEEFRSYIGNVVIPRLQEFGGNDSVEELKYLRSVMAGETTMEPKAIRNILNKASKNIERGIQRIERQNKEIQQGKPVSTGPVGGQQRTTRGGVTYTVEE